MAWIAVGTTVGGALLGSVQQKAQRDQQQKLAQANAESNRYSTYTGKSYDPVAITASPLNGALQGGLSGLAMGQQLNAAGGISGSTKPVESSLSESGYTGLQDGGMLGVTAQQGQQNPVIPAYSLNGGSMYSNFGRVK